MVVTSQEVTREPPAYRGQGDDVDDSQDSQQEAAADFGPGLQKVRKRRLLLWILIGVYLPLMWTAQQFTHGFWDAMPVFGVWFVLLLVVVTVSAIVKCPRCGNYFHMNGMTLLYLRKCLHCQLHVASDKRPAEGRAERKSATDV